MPCAATGCAAGTARLAALLIVQHLSTWLVCDLKGLICFISLCRPSVRAAGCDVPWSGKWMRHSRDLHGRLQSGKEALNCSGIIVLENDKVNSLFQCPHNVHKLDGYMCDAGQVKSLLLFCFFSICFFLTCAFSHQCAVLSQGRCLDGSCKTRDGQCMALWGYSTFGLMSSLRNILFWKTDKRLLFYFLIFFLQALLTDSVMKSWILKAPRRGTVVPTPTVKDGFSALSSEWKELRGRKIATFLTSALTPPTETSCVGCCCAPIWQPSRALASCRGRLPVWPSSTRTDTWTAGEVEESKVKRSDAFQAHQGCRSNYKDLPDRILAGFDSLFQWYKQSTAPDLLLLLLLLNLAGTIHKTLPQKRKTTVASSNLQSLSLVRHLKYHKIYKKIWWN